MKTKPQASAADRERPISQPSAGGLTFEVCQDVCWIAEGTAAEFIAEGLVPSAFVWPGATADATWVADGVRFIIRRAKPPGHKGPWSEADHWRLWAGSASDDPRETVRRQLQRNLRDLAQEYRRAFTPEGAKEWTTTCLRRYEARGDAQFQRFLTMVLGSEMRPGRRRRSA